MRKQCVPGSFFSTHALEPGNEVRCQVDMRGTVPDEKSHQDYENILTPKFFSLSTGIHQLRRYTIHSSLMHSFFYD